MSQTRILARVSREDFVARDAELREIVQQATHPTAAPGLVVFAAPGAGASELLRQSYDQLFLRRGDAVPLHFAFKRSEASATETARRFFKNSLQQYISYRRMDPSLSVAPLTFHDLMELALPTDYELVSNLIETFEREQAGERDFVNFCFSLPHRLTSEGRRVYPLIDCTALQPFGEVLTLGHELATAIARVPGPFALAGLRRQVGELIHGADNGTRDASGTLHLERLSDEEASRLVNVLARRLDIQTNQPTRDLIVQQLNGSPFFIKEFLQAAYDTKTQLTSFLSCQRLYVDELMGGRIKRHFDQIIAMLAPNPQTKKTLLRVLHESAMSDTRKSSLWAWKKRLGAAATEFERIIEALHVCELVNSTAAFIEVNTDSYVWMDYLRVQYGVDVAGAARAKIVATTLLDTLKRAPQTMARKYRRETAIGLRDLMPQFNCQSVPAILFHYDRFAAVYKGDDVDKIDSGLDAESDLIRLPQVVHAAACSAYSTTIACDANRCVVAHGFEAAEYTDENEIVWLVAEIDSKLEASRELTEEWCNRLTNLGRESGFRRVRIWLVAPEGFSEGACELLEQREAFGSSRQQFELLIARITSEARAGEASKADEYEMIIPMGEDTELIAAHTVEQIARRVNFRPEAINQIKTALVEACINAAEHSLSPDRKIYQRFLVEGDKLVVTVASRGVVPAQLSDQNGQEASTADQKESRKSRRGWGLKLIRTLMDEVEFERVDDGTQLRMTKYVR
jgi:serine/threonine-protein kinase RsbW